MPTLFALHWLTPLGPWQEAAVALVGAALFLATVTGASRGLPVILMTVLASALMELFFLSREVRRWFGLFPGQ